jgi:hypothetical protein
MSADLPTQSRAREAATYIAELTSDLARLARENGLTELAYLLDIARLEAEMNAGKAVTPRSDPAG